MESVTLSTIQVARARIGEAIHMSPCHLSHHLSELVGLPLHLKLENLQRTGSFKERGALNKLLTLSESERKRGVIAASAGNHAQGVAFHAAARGIRAQIVMPLATPLVKVAATRSYGAEVVLHGASYDEACDEAMRRKLEQGCTFIHPFDDPEVISGQGTIALELLEQVPQSLLELGPVGRRQAQPEPRHLQVGHRNQGHFLQERVQHGPVRDGRAEPPGLPGGQVRDLPRAAGPAPLLLRLQEARPDQRPDVVQDAGRVAAEDLRDLLVGPGLVQADAQDPQPECRREGPGLLVGRLPALRHDRQFISD